MENLDQHRLSALRPLGQGPCSLDTALGIIGVAAATLGVAIGVVAGFFNIPGLIVAIALLGTVAFGLISAIRDALRAYEICRGPSARCSINTVLSVLGLAGLLFAIGCFTAALALQITALAFLTSWILAWLSIAPAAAAEALKAAGIASVALAIVMLVATAAAAVSYRACRDAETTGPIG